MMTTTKCRLCCDFVIGIFRVADLVRQDSVHKSMSLAVVREPLPLFVSFVHNCMYSMYFVTLCFVYFVFSGITH